MGIGEGMSKDAELVRRVLAGDAAAYGGLVAQYRDRLARYAMRMLGDRSDAEEAVQDAFVRAARPPGAGGAARRAGVAGGCGLLDGRAAGMGSGNRVGAGASRSAVPR